MSAFEVSQEDITEDSCKRTIILYNHPVNFALYVFRTVGVLEGSVHEKDSCRRELLAVIDISGLEELLLDFSNLLVCHR